jgi:hypothetical protein
VGKCRTTVILQRPKHRIDIDLIAWTIQITGAIVAADVITLRRDNVVAITDDAVSSGLTLKIVFLIYAMPNQISR